MFAALKMVMQNCLRFGNAVADQKQVVICHRALHYEHGSARVAAGGGSSEGFRWRASTDKAPLPGWVGQRGAFWGLQYQ
jgi:hypothetical protein